MDSEMIYIVIGITIFGLIAYKVIRSDVSGFTTPESIKKNEIINGYKKSLYEELQPLRKEKEIRRVRKNELLNLYSQELQKDDHFESFEINEILLDISESVE